MRREADLLHLILVFIRDAHRLKTPQDRPEKLSTNATAVALRNDLCRLLFLDRERHGELCAFPQHFQNTASGRVFLDSNRELVHRFIQSVFLQINPRYILSLVVDLLRITWADSPLSDLSIDDQLGRAIFIRKGPQRECASRDRCLAKGDGLLRNEERGLIGPGAPDLAVRHQAPPDFTVLTRLGVPGIWTPVNNHDPIAVDDRADRLVRTDTFLLGHERGCGKDDCGDNKDGFELIHAVSCGLRLSGIQFSFT